MDDTMLLLALLKESDQLFDSILNPIKKRKYWYKIETWVCEICGKETVYRERQYTERPDCYNKRNIFHEDACSHHFL